MHNDVKQCFCAGGLAASFDLAAFPFAMIASVKKLSIIRGPHQACAKCLNKGAARSGLSVEQECSLSVAVSFLLAMF